MGNNLFGANISGKIAKALGSKLLTGVLTKVTLGARDASNLAGGRQNTETEHTFKGILTGLASLRKETIHPDAKDAVLMLGDTIADGAIPIVSDSILMENTNYKVVSVSRDPDAASYTCQVK